MAVLAHNPSTEEVAGGIHTRNPVSSNTLKDSTLQVAFPNCETLALARMTVIRDSCWEGASWVGPGMCCVLMRCDLHCDMLWLRFVRRQGWTLYILLYVNYTPVRNDNEEADLQQSSIT